MYYQIPEPPYLLVVIGFFIGITSGLAFEATLKQKVQKWAKNPTHSNLDNVQVGELRLTFLGICIGICLFLAAGVEVFTALPWFSYGIAILLTLFVGGLIWYQLGSVLKQLEAGGSKALDLDIFQ